MGSRLHGNYGRRRRTHKRREAAGAPTIVIPATAGIHGGGRQTSPTTGGGRTHKQQWAAGDPTIVIPATAGIHRGGPAMGSRLHGNYGGGGGRTHKRRAAAGDPTIVIPATAGIHGEGRRWGPVSTATTGGGRRTHKQHWRRAIPQSSFPRRRESTAGAGDGVPYPRQLRAAAAHPQTTVGGGRSHNRHSRDGGNPRRGPAMGSRLHGNYGRRRRTHKRQWAAGDPTIVIPATAGIHRGGAGDGFPSPRERRWAAGRTHKQHVRRRAIPTNRGAAGDRVPVSTGTTGGGGRSHNRHSRDGGNPQRGAGDGFPSPRGNDGRRRRTHKRHWRRAIPQSPGVGRSIRPINSEQLR